MILVSVLLAFHLPFIPKLPDDIPTSLFHKLGKVEAKPYVLSCDLMFNDFNNYILIFLKRIYKTINISNEAHIIDDKKEISVFGLIS